MRVLIDISGGGNSSATIDYYCVECRRQLIDEGSLTVTHSAREESGIFRKKITPVECRFAGKTFLKPTTELQEVDGEILPSRS